MDKEYIEKGQALATMSKHGITQNMRASKAVAALPAADVAPVVHGKWKPTEYPIMSECEDCSECGYRTVYGHGFKFCPNCGAKMDQRG